MFRKQPVHEFGVADAAMRENIPRVVREVGEISGIARVSKRVKVDEPTQRRLRLRQALPDEIGADETAAAGDEKIHAGEIGR